MRLASVLALVGVVGALTRRAAYDYGYAQARVDFADDIAKVVAFQDDCEARGAELKLRGYDAAKAAFMLTPANTVRTVTIQ